MSATVLHGDCLAVMPTLDAGSVDAIVCDPPYGLGFMGKAWDHGVPGVEFWTAALRVAKPGAHLVAFGGTRTYHRLTCAIEDAGWEIRDCLSWLYGSGFPKSLNVQQSINKAARGTPQGGADPTSPNHGKFKGGCSDESPDGRGFGAGAGAFMREQGAARGDDAGPWQGWGTALKPAWEPIILARKPLAGTVAANVQEHGTGALNIDGSRVGDGPSPSAAMRASGRVPSSCRPGEYGDTIQNRITPERWQEARPGEALGRWPANVCLDEEAAALLDKQSGESRSTIGKPRASAAPGNGYGMTHTGAEYEDFGGASRFFYCAKASRRERDAGLDHLPGRFAPTMGNGIGGKEHDPETATRKRNHHPTVKPLALMRWLCRLVTPPGGLILDPFTGSGSTGCAAVAEGFRFTGIELSDEYAAIARARIANTPLTLEAA